MASEFKFGRTAHAMKGSGDTIRHAGEGSSGMWTATSSKVSGWRTKPMGMESMCI